MSKQKKGEATIKNKTTMPPDISLLDISLKQKQLANKISSKSQWQDAIKEIQTAIENFEESIKKIYSVKITKDNIYEIQQQALALKMNLQISHNKFLNLENSDIDNISEITPAEKIQFTQELDDLRKSIKDEHHLHSLRKFFIGDCVLQLETQTNRLHFMMVQLQKCKNIDPKSQEHFLKESDNIISQAKDLSKELSEFENTIYDERMKNINKIAIEIKKAITQPFEKKSTTKSSVKKNAPHTHTKRSKP